MSGHNKWSKIKHKKGVTDAKKSKAFTKVVRLITAEAKKAKGNKDSPGLRAAIEKAKAVNMPSTNIDRAIQKGNSEDAPDFEVTYETYGPGGSALIIKALTDNKNRIGQEVKHILTKNGLQLASPGSALWMFDNNFNPNNTVDLNDGEKTKMENITEQLLDNDDIQEVYKNYK